MSVLLSSGYTKTKKTKTITPCDSTVQFESFSSYSPSQTLDVWNCIVDGHNLSIALNKETEEIWCNDSLLKTKDETHKNVISKQFGLYNHVAKLEIAKKCEKSSLSLCIKPKPSGNKMVITSLKIDNKLVPAVIHSDLLS